MSKKVAVVTGANKGLGLALVKELCSKYQGTVYLTSRDQQRGMLECENLNTMGLHPEYHQLDVTDRDSVNTFCNIIREKHGKIDLLINNAGILFLKDAKEPRAFQAEQTLHVNFFSLVDFTETMLPLIDNNSKIINISSSSGHLSRIPSEELRKKISAADLCLDGLRNIMKSYVEDVKFDNDLESGWGESSYVVSKVGLNAYTFMLNRRLKSRGIVVNCVHPGYVMSDMTRGAGNVSPEQAAKMVVSSVLPEQAGGQYFWHNGTTVPWDGPDPRGYIDGQS